jgi:serine/threonine protein kinase
MLNSYIIYIDDRSGKSAPKNRRISHLYLNHHLEKTLGQGTFGKVKLAIHERTGQKVAVKVLEKKKIVDVSDI